MNNSWLLKLFLVICIAPIASCNAYPLQPIPMQYPSPTPTESKFRYDWKVNWLNNATCQLPCWEDIMPGKTTLQEAKEIIKDLPGAKITSPLKNSVQWGGYESYTGYASDNGESTILYISIRFIDDQNIDFDETIKAFGQPTNVQTFNCMHGMCDVNIIFSELGLALRLRSTPTNGTVMIEKSSNVIGVAFFTPGIDNYSKIAIFQGLEIKSWGGYGVYQK